jgi:hypothetical protein
MTVSLMVSMLRKGGTGDEILKILDTITSGEQDVVDSMSPEPTDQWIEF